MGSGSSARLSETVKTNSISQEFHNPNGKQSKGNRYQRFSYCSITSDNPNQQTYNPSIYDNHFRYQQQANKNIYFKFPDVNNNASNANTMIVPNRFKSFENFIVPSQLPQQQQQQQHNNLATPDSFDKSKLALTKSLIMYDVDFEKFNRATDLNKAEHTKHQPKSKAIKTMTVSSSIYHDLIELDKDLEKRENDLKQQTNSFPFDSTIKSKSILATSVVNNINRNSSTSSNSSSSSGCSSGASSSNLSVSRRKSANTSTKRTDTSVYSVNTSNCTTFASTLEKNNSLSSQKTQEILQLPSASNSNISNKASPCLLTSASSSASTSSSSSCSNKSILSTSANLSSSCSSFSSPTEYLSPKSVSYNKASNENSKRAQNRRGLLNKTKSECLFNNQEKPTKTESKENQNGIYIKNFSTMTDSLNQQQQQTEDVKQTKKSNKLNKNRDSGIIVDLFHLNGSMTNIKTKLTNAKLNLRNSFSVFNLKHSSSSGKKLNKKKEKNVIISTSSAVSNSTKKADAIATSSMSLNKLKQKNLDINDDYGELKSNNTKNNSASCAVVVSDDDSENAERLDPRENIIHNNKLTTTTTKSKLNTISSSINNFLSNLTVNNTNNINNNYNVIKNANLNNENCFISSTNLVSNNNNNNKTSDIHPSINIKQINTESNLNFGCTNKNSHSLSLSSSNLIASNSNEYCSNNNKLSRFSNSVKINDNKQHLNQQFNNSLIKRTMTFHSTNNSNKNSDSTEINKIYDSSNRNKKFNETQNSFKTATILNEAKVKTINNNPSILTINNLNATSFSFPPATATASVTSNANSNSSKLVNSKTISSFKSKTENLIPVISIEQRSKEKQMRHSTSMGNNTTNVEDAKGLATHRHQKIVVQASTSDLLNCFSIFISEKCAHLVKETYINPLTYLNNDIGKRVKFESRDTINWLRSADRALLIQGWQEIAFMNPVNVVFVYLLVRDTLKDVEVKTVYELQCNIMACLYLAFSYMGNEISYPLKPFLIEESRDIFWQRIVDLMNKLSACMLRINRDPRFFTELFYELKSYSIVKKTDSISSIKIPAAPLNVSNTATSLLNSNNSSYKQLSDQINSIEIKIDAFSQHKNNKYKDDDKSKPSHDKSTFNSFKPLTTASMQLNEPTRLRSGLYTSNENQNPFNSYCI